MIAKYFATAYNQLNIIGTNIYIQEIGSRRQFCRHHLQGTDKEIGCFNGYHGKRMQRFGL